MSDANTTVIIDGLPYDEAAWKLVAEQSLRIGDALERSYLIMKRAGHTNLNDGYSFQILSGEITDHIRLIQEINKAAGAIPDEESEGVQ